MSVYLKRSLAIALAMLTGLNLMTGCNSRGGETEPSTKPVQTEPAAEAKVLKVLTLGHSLAVDSCHMLNLVAHAEGYEEMKIGTLYYSGCSLARHVEYLTNDSREYNLYVSSTTTPEDPPVIMNNVTMGEALKHDYWDIIIMQGTPFKLAKDETYTNGNIQTIQNYVNKNKLNPNAVFGWHMTWAVATDEALQKTYTSATPENNPYIKGYEEYDNDRLKFYNAFSKCTGDHILTDDSFTYFIPSGTAIENAMSSYLTEKDLLRDYGHATDLGRVIAAYTWYCALAGVEQLEEIKLDTVPKQFFRSSKSPVDWILTEDEKALILESVNNALKDPLKVTPSQFTEAPTK